MVYRQVNKLQPMGSCKQCAAKQWTETTTQLHFAGSKGDDNISHDRQSIRVHIHTQTWPLPSLPAVLLHKVRKFNNVFAFLVLLTGFICMFLRGVRGKAHALLDAPPYSNVHTLNGVMYMYANM